MLLIIQVYLLIFLQNFQVKEWPMEDYGKFYEGDSYIVLNVSSGITKYENLFLPSKI